MMKKEDVELMCEYLYEMTFTGIKVKNKELNKRFNNFARKQPNYKQTFENLVSHSFEAISKFESYIEVKELIEMLQAEEINTYTSKFLNYIEKVVFNPYILNNSNAKRFTRYINKEAYTLIILLYMSNEVYTMIDMDNHIQEDYDYINNNPLMLFFEKNRKQILTKSQNILFDKLLTFDYKNSTSKEFKEIMGFQKNHLTEYTSKITKRILKHYNKTAKLELNHKEDRALKILKNYMQMLDDTKTIANQKDVIIDFLEDYMEEDSISEIVHDIDYKNFRKISNLQKIHSELLKEYDHLRYKKNNKVEQIDLIKPVEDSFQLTEEDIPANGITIIKYLDSRGLLLKNNTIKDRL